VPGAPDHDFYGNPRPSGGGFDIGAVEFPKLSLSPASASFSQAVLTTSAAQLFTLNNPATGADVTGIAVSLTGTNASEFAVAATTCGSSLGAGSQCTISVTFTPYLLGPRTATLVVTDTAGTQTAALNGTGTGPRYGVTPASLAFPNTPVTTVSAPQQLTVRNNQVTSMTITARALGGLFGTQYRIAAGSTCAVNTVVASAGTCLINVTFNPVAVLGLGGIRPASLSLTATALTTTVELSGTAILFRVDVTPKGGLGINGTLSFPNQLVNTTSTPLIATLTNYQSTPVTFTGVTVPNPFNVLAGPQTTCTAGATVAPNGGTCTLAIRFAPTAQSLLFGQNLPWLRTATLNLTGSGGVNPTISLTGTATVPAYAGTGVGCTTNIFSNVTTCSDAFPTSIPAGGTSTQTLVVTNPGAGTLTITSLPAITGQNTAGVFTVVTGAGQTTCTAGATVAAGASCNVVILMTVPTPAPTTNRTGTLTVVTPAKTQTFGLSGN
jgi:hypothetical protein